MSGCASRPNAAVIRPAASNATPASWLTAVRERMLFPDSFNEQTEDSPKFATWECVPGSAPEQGEWWDEARGTGNYASCEFINETSSGGTIWRCEYGDL